MSESLALTYRGTFDIYAEPLHSPPINRYNPGDVVLVQRQNISLPAKDGNGKFRIEHGRLYPDIYNYGFSEGGVFLCTREVKEDESWDATPFPGETVRMRNTIMGEPPVIHVPVPGNSPFVSFSSLIAGPQGPVGPQGIAGPRGITWKGPWAKEAAYTANDVVSADLGLWIAVGDVAGNGPAPGERAGSQNWQTLIPRIMPSFQGTWSGTVEYHKGDLVVSTDGLKIFSLTSDLPYKSATPPENDATNWIKVLETKDATILASVSAAFAGLSTIAVVGGFIAGRVDKVESAAAAAANTAAAFNTAIEAAQAFKDVQWDVKKLYDTLNSLKQISRG